MSYGHADVSEALKQKIYQGVAGDRLGPIPAPPTPRLEAINDHLSGCCGSFSEKISRLEYVADRVLGSCLDKGKAAGSVQAVANGDIDRIGQNLADLSDLFRRFDDVIERLELL